MSLYSYRVQSIPITAGMGPFGVEIEGSVITYLTGTPDIGVRLNDRAADRIILSPKDVLKVPRDYSFRKFFVEDYNGVGTVQLMIGRPDIMVDAGQVYVAGSVAADLLGGKTQTDVAAFWTNPLISGVASEYGVSVVWNPSGSNKTLIWLGAYWYTTTTTVTHYGTLFDSIANLSDITAGGRVHSRTIDGSLGVGKVYTGTLTAAEVNAQEIGGTGVSRFFEGDQQYLKELRQITPLAPIIIPEGYGVAWQCGLANTTTIHWHWWAEI